MTHLQGVDVTTPNVARMYDYYLGGKDNFAADRAAAEKVLAIVPEARLAARENRAFLARSLRVLTQAGIRQFLDIGTGLPTQGNVHEIVRESATDAKVVYVDNDPVVLAHARALLGKAPDVGIVHGDIRRPEAILRDTCVRQLIDFGRPVGLLLTAILQAVTRTEDPFTLVKQLVEEIPSGSYLALSHVTPEPFPEVGPAVNAVYRTASNPLVGRTREEILRFFEGLELLDPGLVYLPEWRPDGKVSIDDPSRSYMLGGVARKPSA